MSFVTNSRQIGKSWDQTFCGFNRPQMMAL